MPQSALIRGEEESKACNYAANGVGKERLQILLTQQTQTTTNRK